MEKKHKLQIVAEKEDEENLKRLKKEQLLEIIKYNYASDLALKVFLYSFDNKLNRIIELLSNENLAISGTGKKKEVRDENT